MTSWARDAIFYHLYPLGLCGAPRVNDFTSPPIPRLEGLLPWLDQARDLGADAVLLGPVWESSAHGYDTADLFQVDRRLGDEATLTRVAAACRERGLRLVLDGVFHHVGRHFWAFRDVQEHGAASRFADWFHLDFQSDSPYGDGFAYQSWNGCDDLVKINLSHPEVRSHLLEAVTQWLRRYGIAGLRLDAADHLDLGFIAELARFCRRLEPTFWLMGEVVHGDYSRWLEAGLDAVTNYEAYKGLFSSHNDTNYFEIGHTLSRQFGAYGLYRGQSLYSFSDNHDVDRLASRLEDPRHLFPVYCLLFTMPGTPSIYYGSEFGLTGRAGGDDWPLRPALDLAALQAHAPQPDLARAITRLASLRKEAPALRQGDYAQVALDHGHLVFSRRCEEQWLVVGVSAGGGEKEVELHLEGAPGGRLRDLLNGGETPLQGGRAKVTLYPGWARVWEVVPG